MKLTKLTEAEMKARMVAEKEETCTEKKATPTVKVYRGDIPVMLNYNKYDLPIDAGTYEWLVFVPCELVGEINWLRMFTATTIRDLTGNRKRRSGEVCTEYKIYELQNHGILFAFV